VSAGNIDVNRDRSTRRYLVAGEESAEPLAAGTLENGVRVLKLFLGTRMIALAVAIVALVVMASLLASWLGQYDPFAQDGYAILQNPCQEHLLGTEGYGRDMLSRLLHGGRISLLVGATGSIAALLLGVPLGLVAGYCGGAPDYTLMRFNDALMAFPPILLALSLNAILGASLSSVMLAVAIAYVPIFAMVTRGAVLSQREREYVVAAVSVGVGRSRILTRHIIPNTLNSLLVQLTITFPMAILTEASLSFLGLGGPPNSPSWGRMLNEGYRFLMVSPLVSILPLAAVCLTTWAFNTIGDRVTEVLDPRRRNVARS
jgi:peptide/nickel transport system permease protein